MTKKKLLSLFLLVGFGLIFFFRKETTSTVSENKAVSITTPTISADRKVIDQKMKPIDRSPASTSYVNTPSPDWEKKLVTSLKTQGGNSLKEIKVQKENSLVWLKDENPLLVESVIVTLINHQEMESSFRALVDSQTGKVLESWDRSIADPANVRDGLRIKLDSRYSN